MFFRICMMMFFTVVLIGCLVDDSSQIKSISSDKLSKKYEIIGYIDEVIEIPSKGIRISGWACETNVPDSIQVRIYAVDEKSTSKKLIKTVNANIHLDKNVSKLCKTTTISHRFQTTIFDNELSPYQNMKFAIFGVSKKTSAEKQVKDPSNYRISINNQTKPTRRLSSMYVDNGVLKQHEKEVSLFGVNYYPMSTWHYKMLNQSGRVSLEDKKKAIDNDLDDLQLMGVNFLRFHVYDSELTDIQGNLVQAKDNPHLDLLCYVIDQSNKRGIKVMLTLIAWWWSPFQRQDSFARNVSKEALLLAPFYFERQANYVRNILSWKNRYSGNKIVDDPAVVLLELFNEPTYYSYDVINHPEKWLAPLDPQKPQQETKLKSGYYNKKIDQENVSKVVDAYQKFLNTSNLQNSESAYYNFVENRVTSYIDDLKTVAARAGADQPIGYSIYLGASERNIKSERGRNSIKNGIAAAKNEFITFGAYPGGFASEDTDRQNLLPMTEPTISETNVNELKSLFGKKAKVVYEFGTPGNVKNIYLIPAMAKKWRMMGVQAAAFFQYDGRDTAPINNAAFSDWERDEWGVHFLNLIHTPSKAVSFMIAAKHFLLRPIYDPAFIHKNRDWQVFSSVGVSYSSNAAYFVDDWTYMQSIKSEWFPEELLKMSSTKLEHGVCVNSCFLWDYNGSGIVQYRKYINYDEIKISPDVIKTHPIRLIGTISKPLTRLSTQVTHWIKFKAILSKRFKGRRIYKKVNERWIDIHATKGQVWQTNGDKTQNDLDAWNRETSTFVDPGTYRISSQAP